jgi:hypothetical protein
MPAKKLQSWFVIAETCMLKDALRSFKRLSVDSLYMQGNGASLIYAHIM